MTDAVPDPRALESLLAFWAEAGVDAALNEMLFTGGSLNRKLLGGAGDGEAGVERAHALWPGGVDHPRDAALVGYRGEHL